MKKDVHTKLIATLESLVPLDEKDHQLIRQYFTPINLGRKQVVIKEGSVARNMYFINEGYVRTWYEKDGMEITSNINCPLGFMTAFASYLSEAPSNETMESITRSGMLVISKEKLTALFQAFPHWAEAGRLINEQVGLYNENRARDFVSKTAEERYRQLLQQQPGFIHHVPLQYIASFIGVKPESLSRIRRHLSGQLF